MKTGSSSVSSGVLLLALTTSAFAQAPGPYPPGQYPPGPPPAAQPVPGSAGPAGYPPAAGTFGGQYSPQYPGQYPQSYVPPAPAPKRTSLEIGSLYAISAGYGVGVGVWFGSEIGLEDPATFMIPPALLGLAAPVGVYFLDRPDLPRGVPAAIASGMVIGAGEGIGIASYQFVTADEKDAWGFRGLARATAIGATAGALGGFALGYFQEPSPKSSLFASSGALWGTAIGSAFGYGTSEADVGYGLANDRAGLGGLVGFNVGLVATAALSTVVVPSYHQLGWMWAGAGIGAAASLPVFLFYAGDSGPPAKRGLVFTSTAMTIGIVGAGLLTWGHDDTQTVASPKSEPAGPPAWASLTYAGPLALEDGLGFQVGGVLR